MCKLAFVRLVHGRGFVGELFVKGSKGCFVMCYGNLLTLLFRFLLMCLDVASLT